MTALIYKAELLRQSKIETCGAECCIPPKTNFKNFWDYDKEKYSQKVEYFLSELAKKFVR